MFFIFILIFIPGENIVSPLQNNNHNRSKMTLPKIIHGYKSTVTRQINKTSGLSQSFWQRNYHDHIIRNNKSLRNIREYIVNNPATWDNDKNNPVNYNVIPYSI